MHQTTPAVERAVAGARLWAERLQSEPIRLAHFVLALLDEEEGRVAVLLEQLGISVPKVREQLISTRSEPAPPVHDLYSAARVWSIVHRHDPEFLTDAFLIAVLCADVEFRKTAESLGFPPERLEQTLTQPTGTASSDAEPPDAVFEMPDTTGEVDAARVLDANFNRAREAARVLEDYCRFALDDRFLTEQVKELRHGLAATARKLPLHTLLSARDTQADVGVVATATGEYDRSSPGHVAMVNWKRLQESLRSLEEFGKVFGEEFGREFEALRYRSYTLERAVVSGTANRERLEAAQLYVLLTRSHCVASLDWTIAEAAAGGADVFQLREKDLPDRALLDLARSVRRWTRTAEVLFIVNDRPDIARLAEADGVHLGQDDMTVKDARRIAGPDMMIGVSTHSIEQLRQAVLDGADYVGIGPVFASKTKAFDLFAGLEYVRAACAETTIPAFALGGIDTRNVYDVVAAGASRVAVSSAICTVDDPRQAAALLKKALTTPRGL